MTGFTNWRAKMKLFTIAMVTLQTAATLSSCSKGDSGATPVAPAANPIPLDVDAKEVSNGQCLDLGLLRSRLKAMPDGATLRRYTSDFDIDRLRNSAEPRRNFAAVSAFAHFQFSEVDIHLANDILAGIEQHDCDTVTFSSPVEGDRTLKIVEPLDPERLILEGDDGTRMRYELADHRQLVITTEAIAIDFCPAYEKAKILERIVHFWGHVGELDSTPIHISKGYLKEIALAVQEMPHALNYLMAAANSEMVSITRADIAELALTTIDPSIQVCPYRASPPSGEEPPPPQPTPIPATPTPPPNPDPSPTPAPAPSPDPIVS